MPRQTHPRSPTLEPLEPRLQLSAVSTPAWTAAEACRPAVATDSTPAVHALRTSRTSSVSAKSFIGLFSGRGISKVGALTPWGDTTENVSVWIKSLTLGSKPGAPGHIIGAITVVGGSLRLNTRDVTLDGAGELTFAASAPDGSVNFPAIVTITRHGRGMAGTLGGTPSFGGVLFNLSLDLSRVR